MFENITNVFKYPCNSINIGIMKLGQLSKRKKVISIDDVLKKCVFFDNGNECYAVTLLHNSWDNSNIDKIIDFIIDIIMYILLFKFFLVNLTIFNSN